MKQHIEKWRKFKEKALSRGQQPLSRSRRLSQSRHNEILLLHMAEFLEHEVLPNYSSSPKASLLVEEIHDWKERLRNGT